MGFCQPLFVRFPAAFPVAGVLLLPMYPFGAGFAVFRPVGAGDERRPTFGVTLHAGAAEYLRFQRLVLRQDCSPEPCTADGIGDAHAFLHFFIVCRSPESRSCPILAACPGVGTLSPLRAKMARSDLWTFCPQVAVSWHASPASNISFGRSFTCACPSMN